MYCAFFYYSITFVVPSLLEILIIILFCMKHVAMVLWTATINGRRTMLSMLEDAAKQQSFR